MPESERGVGDIKPFASICEAFESAGNYERKFSTSRKSSPFHSLLLHGAILPMISSRSPRIDWESLVTRLTAAAEKLFRQHRLSDVLRGTGDSPEDLAVGAAMEFSR